jgi:adenosylcobinamide-GDP ribazoletransferase
MHPAWLEWLLQQVVRPIRTAVAFLTRIPIAPRNVDELDSGRSVGFFPLAGVLLGLVAIGLAVLVRQRLPPWVGAVGIVSALAWLTAGLHLDGWADLGDALGGGRGDKERMLAIMRDSRIGAHGAAALILLLLAKTAAVAELLSLSRSSLFLSNPHPRLLLIFPVVARWVVVPLVVLLPYARAEGLGKSFNGRAGLTQIALATVLAGAVVAWAGTDALVPTGAALVAGVTLGGYVYSRLGGLTGDVYGAVIELSETVFLVAALVRW